MKNTNNQFLQFNTFLKPYGFNDSDLAKLNAMCEVVAFKKGEIILNADIEINHIFFLIDGMVRYFIIDDNGKNLTYNFRTSNMTVTGYGFYNKLNGFQAKVSTECLEDCTMVKIPLSAINYMVNNSKYGDRVGRLLAEVNVIELVDFILDLDTKSILERYDELESKFPNINQKVSQAIIASYLRTTPVNLSRIKSKRKSR